MPASCAAWTWADAEATCACAEAMALGFTCSWTVRLSRDDVICCAAWLIRICPLTRSEFCLVLSLLQLGDDGQSAATAAASALFCWLTEVTVSL